MLTTIVTLILGAVISFFLTLYAKPLSDWREERVVVRVRGKAARQERYDRQARLIRGNPVFYTEFHVYLLYPLVIAFGTMLLGLTFAILGVVVTPPLPHPQRWFGVVMVWVGIICYGIGTAWVWQVVTEHHEVMKALGRLGSSDEQGAVQNTAAHITSLPAEPNPGEAQVPQ